MCMRCVCVCVCVRARMCVWAVCSEALLVRSHPPNTLIPADMPACATPVRVAVSLVVVVSLFASLGVCAAGEQDFSGAVCSSAAAARTASASALKYACAIAMRVHGVCAMRVRARG
jgi:hypothetical protein